MTKLVIPYLKIILPWVFGPPKTWSNLVLFAFSHTLNIIYQHTFCSVYLPHRSTLWPLSPPCTTVSLCQPLSLTCGGAIVCGRGPWFHLCYVPIPCLFSTGQPEWMRSWQSSTQHSPKLFSSHLKDWAIAWLKVQGNGAPCHFFSLIPISPFSTSFAPDTLESLTLCQHSTCILSWSHCACCLLCLGYFSFICFLSLPSIIQMLPHQKPSHILHPPPLLCFFPSLHSSLLVFVCLVCVVYYFPLFLHSPMMAGIFLISVSSELSTVPTLDSK